MFWRKLKSFLISMIWLAVMVEHWKNVCARTFSSWKMFWELSCMLVGSRVYLSNNRGRFISVLSDEVYCTAGKRGSLLFRIRRGSVWWIIVWLGWGVGWYWFIGYGMMFFVIRLVLLWRLGYDHLQPSAVVWSCHAWRHQISNRWGYGNWNH